MTESSLWWVRPCAYVICSLTTLQANAGDSRAVLGIKGEVKPMSYDHKPQSESKLVATLVYKQLIKYVFTAEKARISGAGGYVEYGRVNGASRIIYKHDSRADRSSCRQPRVVKSAG